MPKSAMSAPTCAPRARAPPTPSSARTARATRPAARAGRRRTRRATSRRRRRAPPATAIASSGASRPGAPVDVRAIVDAVVVDASRASPRLITWKPPLSVRIGPGQPMSACSPPSSRTTSDAGPLREVVGVRQHDRRAQLVRAAPASCPSPLPCVATGMKAGVSTTPCARVEPAEPRARRVARATTERRTRAAARSRDQHRVAVAVEAIALARPPSRRRPGCAPSPPAPRPARAAASAADGSSSAARRRPKRVPGRDEEAAPRRRPARARPRRPPTRAPARRSSRRRPRGAAPRARRVDRAAAAARNHVALRRHRDSRRGRRSRIGRNVPGPTCSVTKARSTPRAASAANSAGVKCSPAVGAATAPGAPRERRLVALAIARRRPAGRRMYGGSGTSPTRVEPREHRRRRRRVAARHRPSPSDREPLAAPGREQCTRSPTRGAPRTSTSQRVVAEPDRTKQHLEPPAARPPAAHARRDDARVVQHEQIARPQPRGQIGARARARGRVAARGRAGAPPSRSGAGSCAISSGGSS